MLFNTHYICVIDRICECLFAERMCLWVRCSVSVALRTISHLYTTYLNFDSAQSLLLWIITRIMASFVCDVCICFMCWQKYGLLVTWTSIIVEKWWNFFRVFALFWECMSTSGDCAVFNWNSGHSLRLYCELIHIYSKGVFGGHKFLLAIDFYKLPRRNLLNTSKWKLVRVKSCAYI